MRSAGLAKPTSFPVFSLLLHERTPVAAGHVAPQRWESHQNKFIGKVFHIIQKLSSQSSKLKLESRQLNWFRNHIM